MNVPEPHNQRVEKLTAAFEREFGRRPEGVAEAPGRVNLIGEHVDYNDGLVLPFAIDRSVMCAWDTNNRASEVADAVRRLGYGADNVVAIRAYSRQFGTLYPIVAAEDEFSGKLDPNGDWTDYVSGVITSFRSQGSRFSGGDLVISGDVPQGAGLSSSAALEVAVAGAFRVAFSLDIDDVALAKLCQRAENEYVGVQCGIMDQFASTLSTRDHALLIDCRTLAYRHIPLRLEAVGLAVVIANSAVKRELASSAYNDRRRECEEAVALLRERLARPELASLRDVTEADIEGIEIDTTPLRRARHVVTEIARVAAAVDALERDDFAALGQLMVESHLSLRDDYEVSSDQLDLLVGLATAQDYVPGARLTGAGFGGCTVNLVRADAIDAFGRDVIAAYRERTGLPAEMYVTKAWDGLRTWRL